MGCSQGFIQFSHCDRVGHVHFMFVSFLFALGTQCKYSFWWNMGFKEMNTSILSIVGLTELMWRHLDLKGMPSFEWLKNQRAEIHRESPKIPGIPQTYLICFIKKNA